MKNKYDVIWLTLISEMQLQVLKKFSMPQVRYIKEFEALHILGKNIHSPIKIRCSQLTSILDIPDL